MLLELGDVEGAVIGREAEVEANEAEQENETPDREVDRDFPRRCLPVAGAPDADEQEGRDERQFMKRIEEEEIERGKRAHGAGGDKEEAGK